MSRKRNGTEDTGESLLTAACRERLEDAVLRIPSAFGRLCAIAELRSSSGVYRHPLADEFGQAVVDHTLREMHRKAFADWIGLRLQQQERDLSLWLVSLGQSSETRCEFLAGIVRRLVDLIPPQHLEFEEHLFRSDFPVTAWLVCRPLKHARQASRSRQGNQPVRLQQQLAS